MSEHATMGGLSQEEARKLLTQYGPNQLLQEEKSGFFRTLLSVLREPMFLLLLAAAALYFLLGDAAEAATMLGFVLFVAGITLFQEWRTERALQALRDLATPEATVIRDGRTVSIPSQDVVPGDLLVIAEGERVAADAEILQCADLQVDESLLTGESEAVWKAVSQAAGDVQTPAPEASEAWRRDGVYAGTIALQGKAVARVTATGSHTEYGKVGKALTEAEERPTPLQTKTQRLIVGMGWIGLALFLMVVLLSVWRGKGWLEALVAGIALAMGMIPEEFPVVLTVFLALGARRLAQRHALMRRVPAVETLGAASVLCVDKTGTLTQNRMTVRALAPAAELLTSPGDGGHAAMQNATGGDAASLDLLRLAVLASDTTPIDPMEQAFFSMARQRGLDPTEVHGSAVLRHTYAFRAETKRMGQLWQMDGALMLAAKGSPETILSLCSLTPEEGRRVAAEAEAMASRGLRVLAVASSRGDTASGPNHGDNASWPQDLTAHPLELAGLVGLADPPRPEVREAVSVGRQAGIRVIMISGDHAATARAIAREVGLDHRGKVLTGSELNRLSDEELRQAVAGVSIFARVVPAHKLRIVRAFRHRGEVVAMSGDGVNDAPALKEADIGVAMGQRGTEAARQAADMVLMDDNFATIVASVRDGRRIYDNIKKAIAYIIAVHIPIAGLALLAPLLGLPLLLLPVHIVLLELILDPTCSIVFEAEPEEPGLMTRPPRSPAEPLIDWRLAVHVVIQGGSVMLASFLGYLLLLRSGAAVTEARTIALVTLVCGDILLTLANRSHQVPVWRTLGGNNKARYWINGLAFGALMAAIYLPILHGPFGTADLPMDHFLTALGAAVLAAFWWEPFKPLWWAQRQSRPSDQNPASGPGAGAAR